MFKKLLIANRGEIAVRILNTCRELGIPVVALYEAADRDSLHVRRADEAVEIASGFMDADVLLRAARAKGCDAIHPGYGFLAEEADFIAACEDAGITFIGPPVEVVRGVRGKVQALAAARAAGFATVQDADEPCTDDLDALRAAAARLGYPLVIKSCSGGRGPGERLVRTPEHLEEAIRSAQNEAQAVFGTRDVFMERAILPAHQVSVQILADTHGNVIHLGEREGSLQYGSRKVIEESPAPCCANPALRRQVWDAALALARLFRVVGVVTVEFVVDGGGRFYFSEIKARIQTEHPLTEMLTGVDLVREQLRIAAGEALTLRQEDVLPRGHAMMCRINAEDPANRFLPAAGQITRVGLPSGAQVRVDTYLQSGGSVPATYSPLIAKVSTWGQTRQQALQRMERALAEFVVEGVPTNLPRLLGVLRTKYFAEGRYTTDTLAHPDGAAGNGISLRDLAAAAAVLYLRRVALATPSQPERLTGGWHRSSRRLPE